MNVPFSSRFTRYVTIIVRWLVVGSLVFFLTVTTGIYIMDNILTKIYTASAEIKVGSPGSSASFDKTSFQSEFEIVESPEVLLSVIKDLGLDKTWAQSSDATEPDQLPDVDALTRMQKILKIDFIRGTHIIKITAASGDPKEAADIANAVASRYQVVRNGVDGQQENSVLILTRAEAPSTPSKPNRSFDFIVTLVGAGFLSLMAASFVEVVFLLLRAAERTEN